MTTNKKSARADRAQRLADLAWPSGHFAIAPALEHIDGPLLAYLRTATPERAVARVADALDLSFDKVFRHTRHDDRGLTLALLIVAQADGLGAPVSVRAPGDADPWTPLRQMRLTTATIGVVPGVHLAYDTAWATFPAAARMATGEDIAIQRPEFRSSPWSGRTVPMLLQASRDSGLAVTLADLAEATSLVDLLLRQAGPQSIALHVLGGRVKARRRDAIDVDDVDGLPARAGVRVLPDGSCRPI